MHAIARALSMGATVILRVVPVLAATPAAAAPSYSLNYMTLGNGKKVVIRWNPCRTHTYKVNLAAVPSRSRSVVLRETHSAMRTIASRTGIPFSYKGATREVPRVGNHAKQSAEIVIAYTTPAKTNYSLRGSTLGQGGTMAQWRSTSSGGAYTYTAGLSKGFVVIDTPQTLRQLKPGLPTLPILEPNE